MLRKQKLKKEYLHCSQKLYLNPTYAVGYNGIKATIFALLKFASKVNNNLSELSVASVWDFSRVIHLLENIRNEGFS